MKEKILGLLMTVLFKALTPDKVKAFVDAGLDKLENEVLEDGEVTGLKENFIMGVCKLIRVSFGIEDND